MTEQNTLHARVSHNIFYAIREKINIKTQV
jgi:hypothetical protein